MIRLIHGDCVTVMRDIPTDFIDLTVTSPPYDKLRNYRGFTFDFEAIAQELWRLTKPGGVVVWVVGDATLKGSETGTSFRQALFFKSLGFNLHDTMLYSSEKPPQESNRYAQKFEYMFVFSKGKPKTFHPIMVPCRFAGQVCVKRTFRDTRNDRLRIIPNPKPVATHKVKGNIWKYVTGAPIRDKLARQHPATFPEDLARDHIISWSNPGDLVLDPLMGSGTVGKMAALAGRSFMGIDISKEYCTLAGQRIQAVGFPGAFIEVPSETSQDFLGNTVPCSPGADHILRKPESD